MDIKEERRKRRISQMSLAKEVGVSMVTIQLWERGVTSPSEENYQKLLKALEVLPFAEE